MLRNIPRPLEDELFEACKDSYKRGIEVRRSGIRYSSIVLGALLFIFVVVPNSATSITVAATVAASALCIVWALYSVSASLNMQADMLTKLLVHYGETHASSDGRRSDA